MKAAPFAYHAPRSLADALALLAEHGDECKPLAGGQSLVPMLALRLARFEHLIDIGRVPELQTLTADGRGVRIGAMTRQADVEHDADVARDAPLLSRCLPFIGHFQIRNRGTIGGSIAHADPASELPAVALAMDVELEVASVRGTRAIAARDFFVSQWTTATEPDELLVSVRFPAAGRRSGSAIREVARRPGDFAVVGTACTVGLTDADVVATCSIALFGVGSTPVRSPSAEAALIGSPASLPDDELASIAHAALGDFEPRDDLHATGTYRQRTAVVLIRRALRAALDEARHG